MLCSSTKKNVKRTEVTTIIIMYGSGIGYTAEPLHGMN